MNLLKNKLIMALPFIVMAVIFIFSLAMIPSINSAPHHFMTPEPSSSPVRIYINQGMNASASSMAEQMLDQAIRGMNEEMRAELLANFDQQVAAITTKQAAAFASPIVSDVIHANAIGTHSANGNSPVLMFQPLWMASLIANVIFLLVKNKSKHRPECL